MLSHEESQVRSVVEFKVQGRTCRGTQGESLLSALRHHGFEVPSLCFHEAVSPYGACRLCLVEVKKGRRSKLTTSCNYPVQEGLEVQLDTDEVVRHRRIVLQLLLAAAPAAKAVRDLAALHGVEETPFVPRPGEDCIQCGMCVRICELVGVNALGFAGRGVRKHVTTPYEKANLACVGCGACADVCPTGCVKVVDADEFRTIERWHLRVPMTACAACGRGFAPEVHLTRMAGQAKMEIARLATCPKCRGRAYAADFRLP
jgi:NADH dehydrogenase/NADH:ubiquinone oxidoreductase subunit G